MRVKAKRKTSWDPLPHDPGLEWKESHDEFLDMAYELVHKRDESITRGEFDKLSEPEIIRKMGILSQPPSREMLASFKTSIMMKYFPIMTENKAKKLKEEIIPYLRKLIRD